MRNNFFDIFHNEEENQHAVIKIPVSSIQPSRYQPRLHFDETALNELCASIQENGLIQPITVRKMDDHYEIIAGERRYRACCKAGFEEIDCYVLSPSEDQAAQMALVENVQRQDLSAIEEAKSYLQIMRQAHLTQEEVAKKIGKSQSAVANKIRLLNLSDDIQDAVIEGNITERHARAMLGLTSDQQKEVYQKIQDKNFTVRETEAYIEKIQEPKQPKKRKQKTKGYSKNTRIGMNTIQRSVEMIEKLGIHVITQTEENADEVRMIIRFPKEG